MMRAVDPASVDRTYEIVGAQFICSIDANGQNSRCDAKMIVNPRTVRLIAGDLLEQTGGWWRAIKDLPADCEISSGMTDAVKAAYDAAMAWTELLDRKQQPRSAD